MIFFTHIECLVGIRPARASTLDFDVPSGFVPQSRAWSCPACGSGGEGAGDEQERGGQFDPRTAWRHRERERVYQ